MRVQAWLVHDSELNKILQSPEYGFANLLQNPKHISTVADKIDSLGSSVVESLGDVRNSKKYGDGHFFSNKSIQLFGGGTVPRLVNIPNPLNDNYRVVVVMESSPKVGAKMTKEVSFGRSYFYKTNSAIQIAQGYSKLQKQKKPFFNIYDLSVLNQKIEYKQAKSSANTLNIGVQKDAVPYDHHIDLGWY